LFLASWFCSCNDVWHPKQMSFICTEHPQLSWQLQSIFNQLVASHLSCKTIHVYPHFYLSPTDSFWLTFLYNFLLYLSLFKLILLLILIFHFAKRGQKVFVELEKWYSQRNVRKMIIFGEEIVNCKW